MVQYYTWLNSPTILYSSSHVAIQREYLLYNHRRRLHSGSGKNSPDIHAVVKVSFCQVLLCPNFKYYPESNAHDYQFITICVVFPTTLAPICYTK